VTYERFHFHSAHFLRVAFTVKEDATPSPMKVSLLCSDAVVLDADFVPNPIQQTLALRAQAQSNLFRARKARCTWCFVVGRAKNAQRIDFTNKSNAKNNRNPVSVGLQSPL